MVIVVGLVLIVRGTGGNYRRGGQAIRRERGLHSVSVQIEEQRRITAKQRMYLRACRRAFETINLESS